MCSRVTNQNSILRPLVSDSLLIHVYVRKHSLLMDSYVAQNLVCVSAQLVQKEITAYVVDRVYVDSQSSCAQAFNL